MNKKQENVENVLIKTHLKKMIGGLGGVSGGSGGGLGGPGDGFRTGRSSGKATARTRAKHPGPPTPPRGHSSYVKTYTNHFWADYLHSLERLEQLLVATGVVFIDAVLSSDFLMTLKDFLMTFEGFLITF